MKVNKKLTFSVTYQGFATTVRSSGACKTTPVTKKVKVLVGKKKKTVKVQTGWLLTAGKKPGSCNVTFRNSGDSATEPLDALTTLAITKK